VRVFDAPKLWVQTLRALSGVDEGDEVRKLSASTGCGRH